MLKQTTLATLARIAESTMTSVALWYRATKTPDGAGGSTVDDVLLGTLNCRVVLESTSPSARNTTDNRVDITMNQDIWLPLNCGVQAGDKLVVNGVSYRVIQPYIRTPSLIDRVRATIL